MTPRLAQLLKFFQLDPKDAFCAYGIAMEHVKAGDAAEALKWFDQTLAIDPDYAYAHYQKAKALGAMGRSEAAAATIQAGLAAARRTGDAHAAEELAGLQASMGLRPG
jgi:tetratricopeptide (TPR) repeat protein